MIALMLTAGAVGMYPDLIVSSPQPSNSLGIENSAAASNSLKVMVVVAAIGMPLICSTPRAFTTSSAARRNSGQTATERGRRGALDARGPALAERRLKACIKAARPRIEAAIACSLAAVLLQLGVALMLATVVAGVFIEHHTFGDVAPWLVAIAVAVLGRVSPAVCGRTPAPGSCLRPQAAPAYPHPRAPARGRAAAPRRPWADGELVYVAGQGVEELDAYVSSTQPQRALALVVPVLSSVFVVTAIDPLSALVLIVTGPVLVILLAVIGGRARKLADARFDAMSRLASTFVDMLERAGWTLKLFGRGKEKLAVIREATSESGRATMVVLRTAFETALVLELSATVAVALVAVEMSLRLMAGGWRSGRRSRCWSSLPSSSHHPPAGTVLPRQGVRCGRPPPGIFAVLDDPVGAETASVALFGEGPSSGVVSRRHL